MEKKKVLVPAKLDFVQIKDIRLEGEQMDDYCSFLAADLGNGQVCLATVDDPVLVDAETHRIIESKEEKLEVGPHFRIIGMINGCLQTDGSKVPQLYIELEDTTSTTPTATVLDEDHTVQEDKSRNKNTKYYGNWS